MYGRAESRELRFRHQVQAGAILSTAVALGTVLSGHHVRPWLLVATAVAFTFAGALLTSRLDLNPRGPFFGVFALGATAAVPGAAVSTAVPICAATVGFCVAIGVAGPWNASVIAQPPRCLREWCGRGRRLSCVLVHASRYAVAIAAAGSAGLLFGVEHANWAMASAAVPLAAADARSALHPGIGSVLRRGSHRVLGTVAGLGVTALLLLPGLGETPLSLIVTVLLFPTELFMARNYALALGFFTPLIMLMTELAAPAEPVTLLTDRLVDTLIGVAAGIAAAVLVPSPCRGPLRGADPATCRPR
ncbi:FUSC family protein [Amycolatopsis sp. CA-230715]|uniref:FUSC family protein n=1 Tax=Amycolatopsis sp. CA-230715 TaxID=2745196 RepID=UPI0020B3C5E1|nr:FUSC family protein [Amycolatopsis sp. CA-230715]